MTSGGILALSGLALVAIFAGPMIGAAVFDFAKKGRRLTTAPQVLDRGQIRVPPETLVAQASTVLGRPVDPDALALARMVRSEAGSGPLAEKQAVAWVARNDRDAHGWSWLHTLAGPDGWFGEQRGWRYSTARDPYENDLAVAEAVLAGALPDNTGGAQKFVHLGAFGVQPGTRTADEVIAAWAVDGWHPFTVDGARPDFRVFRRGA